MSLHDEFKDLVSSTKLTLLETFDPQTRVAKNFKEIYEFQKKEFPNYPVAAPAEGPEIAILSFSSLPNHITFLSMLEKALKIRFNKTIKVMSGSGWEKCSLVIAPDYGIWADPHLSKNFREGERSGQSYLGQTPLFLLTDLALYMKEPKMKRSLWNALCLQVQKIGSPKS